MLYLALKMLTGDRARFAGVLFGLTFTSFLVSFAASFFCAFMTRGFALISENPEANVWVMSPAVVSVEQTTNMATSAIYQVRSIKGVQYAAPLAVGTAEALFPNGAFQQLQVIGVDDNTLAGAPLMGSPNAVSTLRSADAGIVASGGSTGKLQTPTRKEDRWPLSGPRLSVPTRMIAVGDELEVNDHRLAVIGVANALPRFPPRPLLYTTYSNASRILLPERHRLTFLLVSVAPGSSPRTVAALIEEETRLRARTAEEFKADTVRWTLVNSEDVGDVTAMLVFALTVGFGITGIMLYMFTRESLGQYAVLKAMGAPPSELLLMVFFQAGFCALLGTGVGLGLCCIVGQIAESYFHFPFRMMWFTPIFSSAMVLLISIVAATISAIPVLRLEPASVFAGR